jgi:ABC-type multidrug transport system fused ATPase/permease subunit
MVVGSIFVILAPKLLSKKAEYYTEAYHTEREVMTNFLDENIKGQQFIRGYHLQDAMKK